MVWFGSEEYQRFGVSLGYFYRGGSRVQIVMIFFLQGRKFFMTLIVISVCGGKEGKERARVLVLFRFRERRFLVGFSLLGVQESGVRCGVFCVKERLLFLRGGFVWFQNCLLLFSRFIFFFFVLNVRVRVDVLIQTWIL